MQPEDEGRRIWWLTSNTNWHVHCFPTVQPFVYLTGAPVWFWVFMSL